jgi:hypothetical protein
MLRMIQLDRARVYTKSAGRSGQYHKNACATETHIQSDFWCGANLLQQKRTGRSACPTRTPQVSIMTG